ncbi:hypothetical protein M422DRAFT_57169 [Sphaerobolus stellatus SS14]|uniref:Uncharacterized protein n=1 Tax=Sphaerobolus stellatus (strain SS14) TaxID=990650 RepID=A0A0C9TKY5_SPHS4|nr:hypothetical protein M422DRAFT_57169 [Sphaerobolus stellatus SS14]
MYAGNFSKQATQDFSGGSGQSLHANLNPWLVIMSLNIPLRILTVLIADNAKSHMVQRFSKPCASVLDNKTCESDDSGDSNSHQDRLTILKQAIIITFAVFVGLILANPTPLIFQLRDIALFCFQLPKILEGITLMGQDSVDPVSSALKNAVCSDSELQPLRNKC